MSKQLSVANTNKTSLRVQVLEVHRSTSELEIVGEESRVSLQGVWAQCKISKGFIVHVINPVYDHGLDLYTVNNSVGFVVVEPDNLLTCTLVASSLFCERKTWLNTVFSGQAGTNRAMLVGTLVHEVFQHAVKKKLTDTEELIKFLDSLLDDATVMLEIYSVELHLKEVRTEAITYINSIREWVQKYLLCGPPYPLTNDSEIEVKVTSVSDIEENVWSTKYGLKGKIDVTGNVRIHDKRTRTVTNDKIPLELKTGNPNPSTSHTAQVSLYSMMIEDRYAETNRGFLVYLKNQAAMHNVTLTHNVKRDLIQRRNQINYHMKSFFMGPDMIDQQRLCKNCERLTECILVSEIYTPGKLDQFQTMKALSQEATGHLDDKFRAFFKEQHEKLVGIMITESCKNSSTADSNQQPAVQGPKGSFWVYSSTEAESMGTGFGGLLAKQAKDGIIIFERHPSTSALMDECQIVLDADDILAKPVIKKQKINDYFKIVPKTASPKKKLKSFNTSLNFSRCRVAVSLDSSLKNMDDQNSSTAIAMGFINEIKHNQIVVRLLEGAINCTNSDLVYRLDKVEKKSTSIEIQRSVLVRLLFREDWRCDRVRQLILEPKFKPIDNMQLNLFILSTCFDEIAKLDPAQQKYVVEAVSTDNYYIITEKSESKKTALPRVISTLANVINSLGKSLLIVAPNIDDLVGLLKQLQFHKMRFILIDDGKSTKARYQFAANLVKVPQVATLSLEKKFEAYIRQHELASIVVTTYAMSIGGLLFTRRTFDYCLACDANTTELLTGLSPMFCSDRYIIIDVRDGNEVGDKGLSGEGRDVYLGEHLRALRKS